MKPEAKTAQAIRVEAHILIVEARFYTELADELARGAIAAIEAARRDISS